MPDNNAMKWGRVLEPVIKQEYAEATGRTVLQPADMLRHAQHGFMVANLDGFTEDRRIVEIKTARTDRDWGEPGSDQVPQEYLLQVQHYMIVTGFQVADVAVLIGGSDFRLYEVPADRELQDMMIAAEADFWRRVQAGDPPEPASLKDAQEKYGRASRAEAVEADAVIAGYLDGLAKLSAQIEDLQAQADERKAKVMAYMAERDTLTIAGRIAVTWKQQAGARRFDSTAFKAAHPALYDQFLKQGEPSRRFLLK